MKRVLVACLLLAGTAFAEQITITATKSLDFGEQFAGNSGETIPDTNGGTITAKNNTAGDLNVKLQLLTSSVLMTEPNSGKTINCSAIDINPAPGTYSFPAGSTSTVGVGATRAALSSTQAPGTYTGNIQVRGTVTSTNTNYDVFLPATVRVLPAITITKVRNLAFGGAAANDVARTVSPASANSARFTVTGGTGKMFSIALPPSTSSTNMTTSGGGNPTPRTIVVSSYTSNPSGTGTLDNVTGQATIDVGATRAAIRSNQVQGSYTGSFTVTVTYQ